MICVASSDPESFESIDRYRAEIKHVKRDKPIFLILTKSDLQDNLENPIDLAQLR